MSDDNLTLAEMNDFLVSKLFENISKTSQARARTMIFGPLMTDEEIAAMSDQASRCQICGCHVPTLWAYCEACRRGLAGEDPREAREELSWRAEIAEHGRE